MDRQARLLWMKEVLEHLDECHRQWQFADDEIERYLADAMERDLEELRRICRSLKQESRPRGRERALSSAA